MSHRIIALLLILSLMHSAVGLAHAKPMAVPDTEPKSAFSSAMFIENVGQFADGARFQVWGGPTGRCGWLKTRSGSRSLNVRLMSVADSQIDPDARFDPNMLTWNVITCRAKPSTSSFPSLVQIPHPRIEPFDRLDTVVSYFIGNEPDKWRPDVPVWGGVRYVDLYPGVDLEITSEGGQMVQRLAARPGAGLSAVRLRVEGADAVTVDGDILRLSTAAGEFSLPLLQAGPEWPGRRLGSAATRCAGVRRGCALCQPTPFGNPQSQIRNPCRQPCRPPLRHFPGRQQ